VAVILQCARCMHEQKIDDDKAEKGVPCKICHNLIKPSAKGRANSKSSIDKGIKDEGIKSGPPSGKADKQAGITSKKPKRPRDADGDDDDEDDRRRPSPRKRRSNEDSSSTMMYILLGGGVFVLFLFLCGGGGIGLYFVASGDVPRNEVVAQANPPVENQPAPIVNPGPIVWENPNPGPIFVPNPNPGPFPGPGPNPFQPPENLDPNNPNNIDRVITLLKGPDQQRGPAYTWLKAANPEHPRRVEVATILEGYVNNYIAVPPTFGNDGLFDSFFRWATKNNVPSLINVVDKTRFTVWDNRYRQDAMKALAKLKDPRGAEPIVAKLGNGFDGEVAYKALTEMGPVAEGAVLKYFNARDGRDRARNLVKAYNTKTDTIMTQCIADLDSADNDRRNNAVQWFANTPVDAKRRSDVARALNKSIPKANFFFEKDLAKVIETWGTADNVPVLVQRLQANKTGNDDVIRVLGKLRDPNGVKAIVQSMSNFFNQGAAKAALKEIGPTAEPPIVEAMNMTGDANVRRMYVGTLGEIGTMQSIPALTQVAFRFQQDKGFVNDVQRAIKSIQSRGK
jgi:HEAT repeat protein